jgi:transcriptional regulator with GAF, ATPase, and Fis domain
MIEAIKSRLWSALEDKDVSLAMVYDRSGRIWWHRGRTVRGRTIEDGFGFPKSLIRDSLGAADEVRGDDVVVMSSGAGLAESARTLFLRSLVILPVDGGVFLYVDSGSKVGFEPAEIEVFRVLGGLLGEALAAARRPGDGSGGIVGSSDAMVRVRELVACYAVEEEPVLLTGETGVGKNHVVNALHRVSGRRGKLVTVHCPSVPESLFESEVFGHRRGAFTGAAEAHAGLVEEAAGGTLFLDEVSEVPASVQAKLLALVDTRRYRLLGDPVEREADVRVVAASNRDLAVEVREGRFRADLYYRLAVLPIEIPPLRDRPQDVRDLVALHGAHLRGLRPAAGFFDALERHPWPGNVRELIQLLKRVGIQLEGPEVGAEVGDLLVAGPRADIASTDRASDLEDEIRAGADFWSAAWRPFLDRELNREELRELLRVFFDESRGSLRRMAEAMHLEERDYPRFVSALHRYRVHPGRDVTPES